MINLTKKRNFLIVTVASVFHFSISSLAFAMEDDNQHKYKYNSHKYKETPEEYKARKEKLKKKSSDHYNSFDDAYSVKLFDDFDDILKVFQGTEQAPEGEPDECSQPTRQRANPKGQRTRNLKGEEYKHLTKKETPEEYRERIKKKAERLGLSTDGTIDSIKSKISKYNKEKEEYKEIIKKEAKRLGLSTDGTVDNLQSRISKYNKEKEYREKIKVKAQMLGLSTDGDIDIIKSDIKRKEEEMYREYKEKIKAKAQRLGLSTYGNIGSIKSDIKRKEEEMYRKRNIEMNGYNYYIVGGSLSSPKPYKRETEYDKDGHIVSNDNGRMVGDGQGGKFWAVWGKDDN